MKLEEEIPLSILQKPPENSCFLPLKDVVKRGEGDVPAVILPP